jgi:hypothetical protein
MCSAIDSSLVVHMSKADTSSSTVKKPQIATFNASELYVNNLILWSKALLARVRQTEARSPRQVDTLTHSQTIELLSMKLLKFQAAEKLVQSLSFAPEVAVGWRADASIHVALRELPVMLDLSRNSYALSRRLSFFFFFSRRNNMNVITYFCCFEILVIDIRSRRHWKAN